MAAFHADVAHEAGRRSKEAIASRLQMRYMVALRFGELMGSSPAGWLALGVLFLVLPALRFWSIGLMKENAMNKERYNCRRKPEVTSSKYKRMSKQKSATNYLMHTVGSVVFETAWALGVSWSAGAISPAP